MIRPSGLTLLTGVLLVLLPALAVLQYRWVGQVSTAERERMQRNLRVAALQFREAFDGEIGRAFLSLQVGPATAREGASERYSDRYDTWLNTAGHPKVVANVLLVDSDGAVLRLRRWDPDSHAFVAAEWPEALQRWHPEFAHELEEFNSGLAPDRPFPFRGEDSLLVAPLRNVVVNPPPGSRPQKVAPLFGFTILALDMAYIRNDFLAELAQRHFTHTDGDMYRVAVVSADSPKDVLFQSDAAAPVDVAQADATEPLLARTDGPFFFGRPDDPRDGRRDGQRDGRRDGRRDGSRDGRRDLSAPLFLGEPGVDDSDARQRREEGARWRLAVQHQSGSLEAAVGSVRRRNLLISFGVLLLLTVSVALLAVSSQRAQRLAQQQMEFVAGISHELRTPVAVIRSAAENLSQGIVGSGDRVKRYGQMIESEARRLGEMVERVLQYAGIESGLGLGARTPLAPSSFIEGAIGSSLEIFGAGDVDVHREIAPDLPPVIGDAAALRSAVQNLLANAVKYGGPDHWVGVRAEHVRERRGPEVRITVSDHGAGIPPSELPHIFEPFYRGADAVARQIHGNGLGLSLVKRIVASHGGRVTVTTKAGVGSAFTISLPAAAADAQPSAIGSGFSATART
jgi:signal transduction histidine kinase